MSPRRRGKRQRPDPPRAPAIVRIREALLVLGVVIAADALAGSHATRSARTAIAWLVDLLHDLDGTVTASGIHDRTHLHIVDDLGCDRARGAHLASARTATAIDRLLDPGPGRQRPRA